MSPADWQHIESISLAIQGAVTKYGPQAWHVATLLQQIGAAQNLLLAALAFIVAILFITPGQRNLATTQPVTSYSTPENDQKRMWGIAQWITGAFFSILAGIGLLDVWNWVGLFYPGLAIAHDALSKALGN